MRDTRLNANERIGRKAPFVDRGMTFCASGIG